MITEHHQDQAGLYALAALSDAERVAFEDELRGNAELGEFTRSILRAVDAFALSAPPMKLPLGLLLNFGGITLKGNFRRVANNYRQ